MLPSPLLRVFDVDVPRAGAAFHDVMEHHGLPPLARARVTTLQVNVGRRCNQACHHCHVDAGPRRTETMSAQTAARVLALLEKNPAVTTLDITGGAPELHACFRDLVRGATALGRDVIDRCNLTILLEPEMHDLADFLAQHRVRIVASLPCYLEKNVDAQRGGGVFHTSIVALQLLNRLGYGVAGSGLVLDLVYNPVGAVLPPAQAGLEITYRAQLAERFGVHFSSLFTITNVPIKRFATQLAREGNAAAYGALLVQHFNPATVDGLMCRSLVSVSYDGNLYDCDFNQMLELGPVATVFDVDDLDALMGRRIGTGVHCFACTAGAGSSCGGALV